ncbi:MAG: hypothetical protein LBM08_09350, partial [Dysgonamonadaceae bacterium]|nr:hypothetical protein [Dysgonamonadaceae bacterium]
MKNKNLTVSKKEKGKKIPVSATLFDRMENWMQKRSNVCFWITFSVTVIVSLLLYDPRVSLTGDDSNYILSANSFIKDFSSPGSQATLYVITLSPIAFFFGMSLFPLKLFSLLSMLGFMYFTYASFRRRIPAVILLPVLALISLNSSVLYYASQTYSEAFYMFMLSLFIFV